MIEDIGAERGARGPLTSPVASPTEMQEDKIGDIVPQFASAASAAKAQRLARSTPRRHCPSI